MAGTGVLRLQGWSRVLSPGVTVHGLWELEDGAFAVTILVCRARTTADSMTPVAGGLLAASVPGGPRRSDPFGRLMIAGVVDKSQPHSNPY